MEFIIENVRLRELVAIVNENRKFYDDFVEFLVGNNYQSVHSFINETDEPEAKEVIIAYLGRDSEVRLYNGMGEPYPDRQARWLFLSWLLRDAPAQRLQPLVRTMPGDTVMERRANLLNRLRKDLQTIFPDPASWEWPALSEVLIARLEGSRRALRGTLFEAIVRRSLATVFDRHSIELRIGDGQVRLYDETYDVAIYGLTETVLLPVKTRETMGGGHAMLFTRDIEKAISVAEEAGHRCIPIIVAESWGGNLEDLVCENFVYLQMNPNQITLVEPMLVQELENLVAVFRGVS